MARPLLGLLFLLAAACCVNASRPVAGTAGSTHTSRSGRRRGAFGADGLEPIDGLAVPGPGAPSAGLKSGNPQPPCNSSPAKGSYSAEELHGLADYSQTCQATTNQQCPPCKVWYLGMVKSNACATQTANCNAGFWTYGHLVLPKVPIRGIEDMTSSNPALVKAAEIWEHAWGLNTNDEAIRGVVINSADYRTEHQMHLHLGKLDKKFADNCVAAIPPGVTSFAAAKTVTCKVTEWVHTGCKPGTAGCSDGWEAKGAKDAQVKGITVTSLANVWAQYVAGAGHHPGGADAYHTGLAVARVPGSKTKWLVIMFSSHSTGPGGVGDHEVLWE